MDYNKIRTEATSFRSEMFRESLKDIRFGAKDPYIWGLRDWFKQNFDYSDGAMSHFKGHARLEGESFEEYKDRLWVQKQIIKFR
jgi:hypothetical protein